jgi:probable F420-dependent oxidoreductase
MVAVSTIPTPQLSAALVTFAADAPDDWSSMLETARRYDRAGIDRLVVSDHVVFGEHLDAYGRPETGGTTGGRQPTGPDGHWLEPLTTLSVIAGMTARVRLGTGILLAALRRPVVLAKSAATLDVLSGGRVDLGVGVGWQREEYEAAGLDFDARGRLLDDTLAVCRELWTQPVVAHHSRFLDFDDIHMMPKPVQDGGVPVWVSGRVNAAVVRRIGANGRRWIPWGDDATELERSIPELRARLDAEGFPSDDLQVVANLRVFTDDDGTVDVGRTLEPVPARVAAGATDFLTRFRPRAVDDRFEAQLRALVDGFRALTGREPVA